MSPLQRIAASWITHVTFAFCAMGGWALYANSSHPMPKPVIAGLVQGTMSACLTLFLKTTIDRLSGVLPGWSLPWAPPAIAALVSASILVAIHTIARTPEIATTIAVPLAVATSYAFIYSFIRWKSAAHG